MNFLTHYYLQKRDTDLMYTIGITFPDVISLHNSSMICNQKLIDSIRQRNRLKQGEISLLNGMVNHSVADRKFHHSSYFKLQLRKLSEILHKEHGSSMHEMLRHILYEIFLDRFIMLRFPDLCGSFYHDYERFSVDEVDLLLQKFPGYKRQKLEVWLASFLSERYLEAYYTLDGVALSLLRIAQRLGIPCPLKLDELEHYSKRAYTLLEGNLKRFFLLVKKDTSTSSSKI